MSAPVLLGASSFLSLTSFVFFCAAIGASSKKFDPLKNTGWVYGKDVDFPGSSSTGGSFKFDVYIGFKYVGVETTVDFSGFKQTSNSVTNMNSNCNQDLCKKCGKDSGEATLACLAIALSFAFFTLVVGLMRFTGAGNMVLRASHVAVGFIAFVFSLAAFANYHACYEQARDDFGNNIMFGPGFGLDVVGCFLLFIGLFLSAAATDEEPSPPAANNAGTPAQVPTMEVTKGDDAEVTKGDGAEVTKGDNAA